MFSRHHYFVIPASIRDPYAYQIIISTINVFMNERMNHTNKNSVQRIYTGISGVQDTKVERITLTFGQRVNYKIVR